MTWTDAKNERRCKLISDGNKLGRVLTEDELNELSELENDLMDYCKQDADFRCVRVSPRCKPSREPLGSPHGAGLLLWQEASGETDE